jgi:hypothetical protein
MYTVMATNSAHIMAAAAVPGVATIEVPAVHVYHTRDSVCVNFTNIGPRAYRRDEFLYKMQEMYFVNYQNAATDMSKYINLYQAHYAAQAAKYLYSHEQLRDTILWTAKPHAAGENYDSGPSDVLVSRANNCQSLPDVFTAFTDFKGDIVDTLVQIYVTKAPLQRLWITDSATNEAAKTAATNDIKTLSFPPAPLYESAPFNNKLVHFFRFLHYRDKYALRNEELHLPYSYRHYLKGAKCLQTKDKFFTIVYSDEDIDAALYSGKTRILNNVYNLHVLPFAGASAVVTEDDGKKRLKAMSFTEESGALIVTQICDIEEDY